MEEDFWEIRSTKIGKRVVFQGQGALSPEVSLPKWRAHRPQAKKEGGVKVGKRKVRLSQGEVVLEAKND